VSSSNLTPSRLVLATRRLKDQPRLLHDNSPLRCFQGEFQSALEKFALEIPFADSDTSTKNRFTLRYLPVARRSDGPSSSGYPFKFTLSEAS